MESAVIMLLGASDRNEFVFLTSKQANWRRYANIDERIAQMGNLGMDECKFALNWAQFGELESEYFWSNIFLINFIFCNMQII